MRSFSRWLVSRANSLKYNLQLRGSFIFLPGTHLAHLPFAEDAMLIAAAVRRVIMSWIFFWKALADRPALLERSRHLVRHNHLQGRLRNVWRRETSQCSAAGCKGRCDTSFQQLSSRKTLISRTRSWISPAAWPRGRRSPAHPTLPLPAPMRRRTSIS